MSEPEAVAETVDEVVPGVWRWHVLDERIDAESDAHAVSDQGGTVLIDPLPLREAALKRLELIVAICLTAACHQRSVWRYRRTYGVKVHAPDGCRAMDEEPDVRYRAGELLPGGLKAIHTPGPEDAHYAFWRERSPSVLFCADLIMRGADGQLAFIPAEYHDDPEATRDSVQRLLDLPFLGPVHGPRRADHRRPARGTAEAARWHRKSRSVIRQLCVGAASFGHGNQVPVSLTQGRTGNAERMYGWRGCRPAVRSDNSMSLLDFWIRHPARC